MALKIIPNGVPYISRRRIFIDSHRATSNSNADGGDIWDNANFVENITTHCSNVVAIELTGYNVSSNIASPFPTASTTGGTWAGSRFLDIRINYLANTLDFSVEMPYVRDFRLGSGLLNNSVISTMLLLADTIQTQMNALATAPFVTGTTQWGVGGDSYFSDDSMGAIYLYAQIDTGGGVLADCNVTFQFASGPNAGNSPYKQLGFDTQVDVGGAPVVLPDGSTATWPIPDRFPDFFPQRYVNVTLDQFKDKFDPFPHARVFLGVTADYASTSKKPNDRPRLITGGPRRLVALSVHLTLDQGRPINELCNFGTDLIYDVLQADPQLDAGQWSTQQTFAY